MLFLYILRFNLNIQQAKDIKHFFSLNKIKVLKKEKYIDKKPSNIEVEDISDIEEQAKISRDLININQNIDINKVNRANNSEPQLLNSSIQPRILGRKRKYIEDNIYKCYQVISIFN